jgi:polyhydroxybutyrate depolymerase
MHARSLALLCLFITTALLLTGCARARERRDARQAASGATATVEASANAPSAPPPSVAPSSDATAESQPLATPPSSNCGGRTATGSSIETLESDGVQRSYRLYVPSSYQAGVPTALVLNYHGLGSNALEQERYSDFPALADREGFIVATPEGTGQPQEWYLYGPVEAGYVDDFAFTDRLIDEVSAHYCIDASRVYATGISNGGGMTSLVGCVLSDRIAAIAPVAGSPYVEERCRAADPVPIIAFHGTDDPLVPFEPSLGVGRLDLFSAGVRNNMHDWAQHNGCDLTLHTQRVAADVVLESYANCDSGADVELYVIEGGGHTWPGASRDIAALGNTTHSISATTLAWQFFQAHPRP